MLNNHLFVLGTVLFQKLTVIKIHTCHSREFCSLDRGAGTEEIIIAFISSNMKV